MLWIATTAVQEWNPENGPSADPPTVLATFFSVREDDLDKDALFTQRP